MDNSRTNNNNINNVTKDNENCYHHLGEKGQIKTKKLVVNEKKKVFVLGDSMVKEIQGRDISKKLENKQSLYQTVHQIKSNLYE